MGLSDMILGLYLTLLKNLDRLFPLPDSRDYRKVREAKHHNIYVSNHQMYKQVILISVVLTGQYKPPNIIF